MKNNDAIGIRTHDFPFVESNGLKQNLAHLKTFLLDADIKIFVSLWLFWRIRKSWAILFDWILFSSVFFLFQISRFRGTIKKVLAWRWLFNFSLLMQKKWKDKNLRFFIFANMTWRKSVMEKKTIILRMIKSRTRALWDGSHLYSGSEKIVIEVCRCVTRRKNFLLKCILAKIWLTPKPAIFVQILFYVFLRSGWYSMPLIFTIIFALLDKWIKQTQIF